MTQLGARTKHKLGEARFFFEQLAPNYGKLKKFDYYLSAFISSARSVLWVMRSEFAEVPGWEEWYKSHKPDDEEAALLKGTNAVRIRTEKLGSLQTASTFIVQGITMPKDKLGEFQELMAKAKGKPIPMKLAGTSKNCTLEMEVEGNLHVFPATEVILKRKLEEFPEREILEVCEKYYDAISAVVHECNEKFNA